MLYSMGVRDTGAPSTITCLDPSSIEMGPTVSIPVSYTHLRIRDELKARGIEVTDVPGGAVWKRV